MKRTFKVKVELNPLVAKELFRQAKILYDYYTTWAYENQSWSKKKCHLQTYSELRKTFFSFPSALLQTVRDNALESCKQCKLKTIPKKKTNSIRYDARTMRLRGNVLWLSTTCGRQKIELSLSDYHKPFLTGKLISCTLLQKKSVYFAALVFELPTPEKLQNYKTIGIDRGVYNIAVTSEGEFHSSSKIRSNKRRNLYNRKRLQAKGTKSAKKKLQKISGREMRFSRDVNHVISKKIANSNGTTFVLERLEGITKNRRKHARKKRLNKRLAGWAFRQLANFLTYKAEALGKSVVYVDARYTSTKCSFCKQREDTHRNKSRFRCAGCKKHLHADLNAALNIRDDYLISSLAEPEKQAACQPAKQGFLIPKVGGLRFLKPTYKPTVLTVGS